MLSSTLLAPACMRQGMLTHDQGRQTSEPEATKAAEEPPKQERMMKRGCRVGAMRYSMAGSRVMAAASSARAAPSRQQHQPE